MGAQDALDDLLDWFGHQMPEYSLALKFANALNLLRAIQTGKADKLIEEAEREFIKVIKMTTPIRWARRWLWVRNWLPLQLRLFIEQIFWRLGEPYLRLITGFGPIKLEDFRHTGEIPDVFKPPTTKGEAGGKKDKRRPPRRRRMRGKPFSKRFDRFKRR